MWSAGSEGGDPQVELRRLDDAAHEDGFPVEEDGVEGVFPVGEG